MGFKQKRKIVKYGKASYGIVLPKEWLDYYGLRPGDEVILFMVANSFLLITPTSLESTARSLSEQNEGLTQSVSLVIPSHPEDTP